MSKFIITLMGYLVSFMLGSIFTISYVNCEVNTAKQHIETKEKITVTSPKIVEPFEVFEASYFLPEITVTAVKDTTTLFQKYYKKGHIIVRKPIIIKSSLILNKTTASLEQPLKTKIQNEANAKISKTDAKARSPGLKYPEISNYPTLRIASIKSYSNTLNMHKKNKQHLKAILQLLFTGKKSFRIKSDGTIVIKKHWYSRKKVITSIKEVINYIIPKSMIALSKDLAEDYQQAIVELNNNNSNTALFLTAYNHFSNFCLEVGYAGRSLPIDYEQSYLKKSLVRTKNILTEQVSSIKQLNLNVLLTRWVPSTNNVAFKKIKALPSASLLSLQEILETDRPNYSLKQVGICLTGIPNLDRKMARVYRLTESLDLI